MAEIDGNDDGQVMMLSMMMMYTLALMIFKFYSTSHKRYGTGPVLFGGGGGGGGSLAQESSGFAWLLAFCPKMAI